MYSILCLSIPLQPIFLYLCSAFWMWRLLNNFLLRRNWTMNERQEKSFSNFWQLSVRKITKIRTCIRCLTCVNNILGGITYNCVMLWLSKFFFMCYTIQLSFLIHIRNIFRQIHIFKQDPICLVAEQLYI